MYWIKLCGTQQIVLIYLNQDGRFNSRKYSWPEGIIKNDKVIVKRKNICNQPIDSKQRRNLTTGPGEEYTIGFLLGWE